MEKRAGVRKFVGGSIRVPPGAPGMDFGLRGSSFWPRTRAPERRRGARKKGALFGKSRMA